MAIDDLPISEAAQAKMQLPQAEEAERQAVIEDVRARYPKQNVDYLKARIQEARGNIARFQEQRNRIGGEREKYRILLHDVRERDKKIKEAEEKLSGDALKDRIKALNKEHPWQLEGLKKQIEQFGESIQRFENTVEREQKAIDELTELLGKCKARDQELTRLGA
jgi:chromosome segregation ATPase